MTPHYSPLFLLLALVTVLSCALDHSSNALALAQALLRCKSARHPHKSADMVAEHGCTWRVIASMEQAAAVPVPQIVEDVTEVIRLASQERVDENIIEETVEIVEVEKLGDSCAVKAPAWEEPQRLRAEGSVATHVTNEFLEDGDELIPKWLNRIVGTVDSEDHPLDISGETLLQDKIMRVIKKNQVKKCLEILAEIAELKDDYEKFYEQYGKCRNDEDSTVGVKTAELLTFNTSGDEQICSREHVDRMKEGQNDIWHITGESIAVVSSSPFEENLRQKGLEVLYMVDPVDEHAVQQLKEFDGKKLKSTTKEGLDIGDEDEKKTLEELNTEPKPSTKLMKDLLGDKVEMVIASDRIIDSPCALATSENEYGWSAKVKRIMETQALRVNSMTSHMVSKKTIEVNPTHSIMMEMMKKASALQQQHKSNQHQPTKNNQHQFIKQSAHQERGGESKKERDQEGRKEEERKVEERGSERVKKDAMGWTVVARKKKRKTVQIFVKVDGSKVSPMEVSLTDDRVEDVMRRIQNDEDAYVTMHGRVLKKGERLRSCGVTDGCTVQVTSRLRGGGKHKDKKGQKERKRAAKPQGPEQKAVQGCDRDAAIRMIEENEESRKMMVRMLQENEDNRKMIESMSEGSDIDMEQTLQNYQTACRDVLGWDREQVGMMERGLRWAVEARRKDRREEQEQRRQEQQEETRPDSTDEPEVTSKLVEVRTGRGSAGLVRGGDGRHLADESNRTGKGKGKGNEGKGEHEGKGDKGGKGFQHSTKMMKSGEELKSEENETHKELKREEEQETAEEDEGRVRMAPNMGAGGSHPQAMTDPEEETRAQEAREEQKRAQEAREEQKRAQEARDEESRAQEAREEESRAQEAREEESRAQEAREEESRAQEAREEESRAQEAREEQRAQEAREEQRRAQEAQDEKRAHDEQERLAREAKAQEERREQDREAVTQEGHEGEVKAQEEQGEEANSLHEGSHVSDRHMTWWRNAWWVRVNNGPHLQTARDRRRVWRAATRAAQEVRDTGKIPGGEREKWEQGKTETNTLHIIFHFNPTAAAAAASAATVRLQ